MGKRKNDKMIDKIATTKKEPSDLANRISYFMRKRDYTSIAIFERQAGVPKDCVRRLLGGFMQSTSAENVSKVAVALGVSVNDLVGRTGDVDMNPLNIAPDAQKPQWIKVGNNAMHPTFKVGDYLLVDYGENAADESGIYAIRKNENVIIRRIVLDRNKILTRCDNSVYEPEREYSAHEIEIAGKVLGVYTVHF